MKTRLITLLMALFAIAWGAEANEITSLKLTISHNGGDFFEVLFPAEGWPDLDLTDESTTSIRIKRIEVQTSGTVSDVVFKATMYKTEKGLQPDDDWRSFNLPQQGNTWVLDFGDQAPDLIDDEMKPAPRTFQFFVQAQDGSGKAIYYNNGGQDYKVLFVNGGGSSSSGDIKSLKLTISHNGGEFREVSFPAEGWPDLDLTDESTTSIRIKRIEVQTSGTVSDVVFKATMYKTEKGLQPDDDWRSFNLPQQGNTWVLDFGDQAPDLIDDEMKPAPRTFQFFVQAQDGSGKAIYYNNGGQDYKVLFVNGGGSSSSGDIKSMKLTINHDGDVFTVDFPASGWPEQVIEGQTTSLKILKAEVETDVPMTYVGFCATMYSTSEGWQHNDDEWVWIDLLNQGGNRWVLDMGEGTELVESKWLTENKTKTFEFFVQAGDANGNSYYFANGVNEEGYHNNYKVTFSTGEGGGGGQDQDWKVKFYKENTATLSLIVNGEYQSYVFNGDGTRQPDMQPGDAYSLAIDGFNVMFIHNDNVKVSDVSIQYKLYEDGQDGGWNRIDATSSYAEDVYNPEKERTEHRVICGAYNLGQVVAAGLEYGKNYVLEVIYQVVTSDGDYFFLGKNKEGSYFRFYYDTETGISLTPAFSKGERVYNLAGQRVGDGYRGIIVNKGQKVFRK